jgi:hypothetical protein
MAGVRGHAGRAVGAGAALPGQTHHPCAAGGSVRLVAGFGADGRAGGARDRPRTTGLCWRAEGARRTARAGAAATNLVLSADSAVRLRLLRIGAGGDALRTGRLSDVTGVGRRAADARGAGRHVGPAAVRRLARRASPSGGPPSPAGVDRAPGAACPRGEHGAIPRKRLVPKTTAETPGPEGHGHQHPSSKHL